MDFTFTEEQDQLRRSLRAYLDDRYPFADRLAAARGDGWRPEIWHGFASDLGILGIGIPAALGGTGGGAVEHLMVMEELGRALSLEPYLETVILAGGALAADGGETASAVLRRIVTGECATALAWAEPEMRTSLSGVTTSARAVPGGWRLDGAKSAVASGGIADLLLVVARTEGGLSLFLLDPAAEGVAVARYPTIDGRRGADVILTDAFVPPEALIGVEGAAGPLVEALLDRGIAAVAAEGVGAMARARDDTRDYIAQRRQFGRTLGEFQVIQHQLVDMFVEWERAVAATYLATLRLDDAPAIRAKTASSAKVTLGKAMRFVGQNAVQLHGGMGMTDDLAVGHAFKRMTMIDGEFGSVDHHLARYARLSDLASG